MDIDKIKEQIEYIKANLPPENRVVKSLINLDIDSIISEIKLKQEKDWKWELADIEYFIKKGLKLIEVRNKK